MTFEVLDDQPCQLGEGPVWDAASGQLVWVDILQAQVHRRAVDGSGPRVTETFEHAIGYLALRADGGWLVADARGVAVRTGGDAPVPVAVADLERLEGGPHARALRSNDGGVDPAGRFWFGTIAWDGTPGMAALYRMDDPPHGPVTRVLTEVSISNGIGWSPDATVMYYVDSGTGRVDRFAYDLASGEVADRRPLATIPADAGVPDGLAVDAEGAVWVALFGGSALRRYLPDGRLDRVVALPAHNVTSCAFVGDRLDRLAVTTATVELDAPGPLDGATFLVEVDVPGLEVPTLAT